MEDLTILIFLFLIFSPIITKHIKLNFQRDKDIYIDEDEELSMKPKYPFHISFDKEITYIMDG